LGRARSSDKKRRRPDLDIQRGIIGREGKPDYKARERAEKVKKE